MNKTAITFKRQSKGIAVKIPGVLDTNGDQFYALGLVSEFRKGLIDGISEMLVYYRAQAVQDCFTKDVDGRRVPLFGSIVEELEKIKKTIEESC